MLNSGRGFVTGLSSPFRNVFRKKGAVPTKTPEVVSGGKNENIARLRPEGAVHAKVMD
jgi:hypothetical protein